MAETAPRHATYHDLQALPDHVTGEILAGELVATPRPSRRHSFAASHLGGGLVPPYGLGRGGPGGWVILVEPELGLGEDILVPDLAGWKRERFPREEADNWISVAPDWVCEILSPSTFRKDRITKMAIYARHGVPYAWYLDPGNRTLECFQLGGGVWALMGTWIDDDRVRAAPFQEVAIDLGTLWL
ncbi:MAG: Uma2 family endonuclease [Thermodesulfobacteriota bacterium]